MSVDREDKAGPQKDAVRGFWVKKSWLGGNQSPEPSLAKDTPAPHLMFLETFQMGKDVSGTSSFQVPEANKTKSVPDMTESHLPPQMNQ